jgi:bla regulator protein blaR1
MFPDDGFLKTLGLASTAAAALVLVILALRRSVTRATAHWRMALWTVLLVRMALVWVPLPSFRLTVPAPSPRREMASRMPKPQPRIQPPAPSSPQAPRPERPTSAPLPWETILLGIWGLGAAILLLRLIQGNVAFWLAVRRGKVLTHQPTLELLERCKDDLGVRTVLGIIVTERVPSPALAGFVRPRLLLPPQVLETLSPDGLRHVFLHELVHLKRWDILTAWVCSLLQMVHWFNPLVWLAFRHLRADRELACDEDAVRVLPPSERADYGRTLLRLQELLAPPSPLPTLAGVVEESSSFTRRIKMIARFNQASRLPRWTPLAATLLGLFTLGAFSFSLAARSRGDTVPPLLAKPILDKVDYPFVDDPQVVGTWRLESMVPSPEAFVPGRVTDRDRRIQDIWRKEIPFMMPFSVFPGGRTSSVQTWTRGLFLDANPSERTACRYQIRTQNGTDYLLMEFKNGDYTFRGMTPEWVAFRRESSQPMAQSRREDKVDIPFVNDPALLGAWTTVDMVRTPEEFQPGKRVTLGELFFKGLDVLPGGKTSCGYTWTKDYLLHLGDRTASRYFFRELDGRTYLFMEWKSGDYTLRGATPPFCVLTR